MAENPILTDITMPVTEVVIALVKSTLICRLHGIRNQCIYFNQPYEANLQQIEVTRLLKALEDREVVQTKYQDIQDLLAHTRQIANIPANVWDRVLKIIPIHE